MVSLKDKLKKYRTKLLYQELVIHRTSKGKILFITDMHLLDRETSKTSRAVENNEVIFSEIIQTVEEDKEIILVIFGGDIQDRKPRDYYEVSKWRKFFSDLSDIMSDRLAGIYLESDEYPELMDDLILNKVSPLLAVRGNHDSVNTLYKKVSEDDTEEVKRINHTFFDDLVNDKKILNLNSVTLTTSTPNPYTNEDETEKLFIDLRNYGEADRKLPNISEDINYVVTVFHDNIVTENSTFWQKKDKHAYKAEDVMIGSDLGIVNHIHIPLPPEDIEIEGKLSTLWQVGSVGRVKYVEDEIRDVGYSGILDIEDKNLILVSFNLIPSTEYFKPSAEKERILKKDYSEMQLNYSEVIYLKGSPIDLIKEHPAIKSEEVRKLAIKILQGIEDGEIN